MPRGPIGSKPKKPPKRGRKNAPHKNHLHILCIQMKNPHTGKISFRKKVLSVSIQSVPQPKFVVFWLLEKGLNLAYQAVRDAFPSCPRKMALKCNRNAVNTHTIRRRVELPEMKMQFSNIVCYSFRFLQ